MSAEIHQVATPRYPPVWAAWLWWMIASILGAAIGSFLAGVVGFFTFGFGFILSGALIGLVVGAAQGWMLRYYAAQNEHFTIWASWAVVSSIGGGVAFLVPAVLLLAYFYLPYSNPYYQYEAHQPPNLPMLLITSFSIGAFILGTTQWLILRRYMQRAVLWIPANVVGWSIGGLIQDYVTRVIIEPLPSSDPGLPAGVIMVFFVAGTVATVMACAVTSFVLVLLLQKPRQVD